jgi:hypothetical protein
MILQFDLYKLIGFFYLAVRPDLYIRAVERKKDGEFKIVGPRTPNLWEVLDFVAHVDALRRADTQEKYHIFYSQNKETLFALVGQPGFFAKENAIRKKLHITGVGKEGENR